MYYSALYDRLYGWLYFGLACIGILRGHLGTYAIFSTRESWLMLVLGLFGMFAARSRLRTSISAAFVLSALSVAWAMVGVFLPANFLGSTEPFETAIRFVSGMWGLYVSVQDVLAWRNT